MANWINNLFGLSLTPTVSFIILFAAIILGVLLLVFIARKLLGGTFVSGGRGRHLRLAVMDATPVDSRRRLVLVRRDDVEHLILIGGPTDVVVEQNIRIDGPREAKHAKEAAQPPIPPRPAIETAKMPEPAGAEPPRPMPPSVQHPAPATARPQPIQPPLARPATAAPMPRPAAPPYQPAPFQPAPTAPRQMAPAVATPPPPVAPPRPPLAPAPRVEPVAAALASRADPVMAHPVAAPVSTSASLPKPSEDDLDESLLADLSDSLSFDGDDVTSESSLEKEMESLLSTLDTKKDRIS